MDYVTDFANSIHYGRRSGSSFFLLIILAELQETRAFSWLNPATIGAESSRYW
jgi:hypothetical protein